VIGPPKWIGEASSHDELVAVLRERQIALGLSNETLDHIALMTSGHSDKILGPSRQRGLSQLSLDALMGALAVKLIIAEDAEQAARMRSRWEGKDNRQVRLPSRIAKDLIARVRPAVLTQLASRAATARWARIGKDQRREIMRAVWTARRNVRAFHGPSAAAGGQGDVA
jgi:hypothetical protein